MFVLLLYINFILFHIFISLNLSNINTDKVIDMSYMFYDCSSLNDSNLHNIDTNYITKMNWIFIRIIKNCKFFELINKY